MTHFNDNQWNFLRSAETFASFFLPYGINIHTNPTLGSPLVRHTFCIYILITWELHMLRWNSEVFRIGAQVQLLHKPPVRLSNSRLPRWKFHARDHLNMLQRRVQSKTQVLPRKAGMVKHRCLQMAYLTTQETLWYLRLLGPARSCPGADYKRGTRPLCTHSC